MKKAFGDPLSANIEANIEALTLIADEDIDLSDMPEDADPAGWVRGGPAEWRAAQPKVPIDRSVLDWFSAREPDPAGAINRTLRAAMLRAIRRDRETAIRRKAGGV